MRAHEQASVAARMAADAEIAADAARREHAAAHGLPAPLDEAVLDGLGDAAAELPRRGGGGRQRMGARRSRGAGRDDVRHAAVRGPAGGGRAGSPRSG